MWVGGVSEDPKLSLISGFEKIPLRPPAASISFHTHTAHTLEPIPKLHNTGADFTQSRIPKHCIGAGAWVRCLRHVLPRIDDAGRLLLLPEVTPNATPSDFNLSEAAISNTL